MKLFCWSPWIINVPFLSDDIFGKLHIYKMSNHNWSNYGEGGQLLFGQCPNGGFVFLNGVSLMAVSKYDCNIMYGSMGI